VRASDAEKALARLFPNEQDFRADLELSPILTAILREYDTADKEKPSLKDLIAFAREVMKSFPDKKWEAWTSEYKNRSPLFTEVIQFLRKSTARGKSLSTAFLELLEQPDALQGWKPLQWAAFVGRVDDFKLVLLNGADAFAITASGRSLIHQAAATGSVEVLEYIFANDFQNRGLDINARDIWGDTPLHIVAELSAAAIEILMKYRADLEARSPQGQVPLHYTRYLKGQKRVEAVRAFLKHGNSQANALDENGRSPMFYFLDSPQSVSLLLDHHADVSVCDSEGKTIIHHICGERRPYLLRMMLKRCPLEVLAIKDNAGDTPLFSAFRNHSEECVKLLLNRAPFSSLEDKDGWTLVHHAVKMGDVSVLEYVLTVPGISLYAKNKLGQDAFAIAREMGTMNQRIGEILAKAASVC
jgi:ankyrin repeat protein